MALMFKCNQEIVKPVEYKTLTVRLNLNDSNPLTWATYFDDAVGMTPGSDDFDSFFGHYPCILENGRELGTLKRNNFGQYISGSTAPISTVGKDVMIALPRRGYKITRSGNYVFVSITGRPNAPGYSYMPFSYCGNPCSKVYVSAYPGVKNTVNGVESIYSSTTGTLFGGRQSTARTLIHNRGANYEMLGFYQQTYIQAMYIIKYCGQEFTTIYGIGTYNTIGFANTYGMDAPLHLKLLGFEALATQNTYSLIDGLYAKNMSNNTIGVYVSDGNYNDSGTGYTYLKSLPKNDPRGGFASWTRYLNGNSMGFIPSEASDTGDADTYFGGSVWLVGDHTIKQSLHSIFSLYWEELDARCRLVYLKEGD